MLVRKTDKRRIHSETSSDKPFKEKQSWVKSKHVTGGKEGLLESISWVKTWRGVGMRIWGKESPGKFYGEGICWTNMRVSEPGRDWAREDRIGSLYIKSFDFSYRFVVRGISVSREVI